MFRSNADDLGSKDAENAIARIGTELSSLRTKRGERLEDIGEYLGIKPTYLYGLELGDLSIVSSKRRIRSYIFNYANYLGLDGEAMTKRLATAIDDIEGAKAPSGLWKLKGVDRHTAIILATSVVLGIVTGWWYLGDTAKLDLIASPVTANAISETEGAGLIVGDVGDDGAAETLAVEAEEALTRLEERVDDLESDDLEPAQTQGDAQAGVDTNASATDQIAAASSDQNTEAAPKGEELPANVLATLIAKSGGGAEIYEAQNTDARVIVRALDTSWVQVSSADRSYIWTRTMQPKEMLLVPNREDLELWAGDASGVEILLDGAVLPSLGPAGTVVRGVSLAPGPLEALSAAVNIDENGKPTF